MINKRWLALAGQLLSAAAEDFSNHGCNDWKWPADWTSDKRRELATAMVEANIGRPRHAFTASDVTEVESLCNGDYGPPDWWVMKFLGKQLQDVG